MKSHIQVEVWFYFIGLYEIDLLSQFMRVLTRYDVCIVDRISYALNSHLRTRGSMIVGFHLGKVSYRMAEEGPARAVGRPVRMEGSAPWQCGHGGPHFIKCGIRVDYFVCGDPATEEVVVT